MIRVYSFGSVSVLTAIDSKNLLFHLCRHLCLRLYVACNNIPMPTAPDDNDTALIKIILNRKIDIYVKRDVILDENL